MDTIEIVKKLIAFKSITPHDKGAIDFISNILKANGFVCNHLEFGNNNEEVKNLYASFTNGKGPNICFAGHTDVVPPGNLDQWKTNPFSAVIKNGILFGRGANDMKGAIGSFLSAGLKFIKNKKFNGTLSFLITGDEEGIAEYGTKKVVEWLENQKIKIDFCVVGEPTNPNYMGEMVKIGRRGSLNGILEIVGKQGHVAYPERAKNPFPDLLKFCEKLIEPINDSNNFFQNSNIEITSIDTGNEITNLIPSHAKVLFNVRFNNSFSSKKIIEFIKKRLDGVGKNYEITFKVSGESFYNCTDRLSESLVKAIRHITGKKPQLSTNGGTSDARFISNISPVIEFGLVGKNMHQVNESISVEDVKLLSKVYLKFLENIFCY